MLTGRLWFCLSIYFGLIAGFLGLALFPNLRTPFGREKFPFVLMCVSGIAFVLGSYWAFVVVRRRALIRPSVAWAAFTTWGLLSALAVLDAQFVSTRSLTASVFAVGLLALTVAPLATAPLALAWNRTR